MGHDGRVSAQAAVSRAVRLTQLQERGRRACLSSPAIQPLPLGYTGVVPTLGSTHSLACRSRLTNCRHRQKRAAPQRWGITPVCPENTPSVCHL